MARQGGRRRQGRSLECRSRRQTHRRRSAFPIGLKQEPRSIEALWDRYRKSTKFTDLAKSTRDDYERKIKLFLDGFEATKHQDLGDGRPIRPGDWIDGYGPYNAAVIDKPICYAFAERVRFQRGRAMGNGVVAVARRVFSYAELIGWREARSNPAFRLELSRPAPRLRLGTPAEIAALVAAADRMPVRDKNGRDLGLLQSMGDAIVLALHSGQRQKDVLAIPETIVDAERIKLSQFKTGAPIDIKMTPTCARRMAEAKARHRSGPIANLAGGPMIVHEATGQAYQIDTFRHLFNDVRKAAEAACPSVADFQFMDLRDTAVTRLALADCTKWQIGSITGHSFESIDRILKHYLVLTRDFADPAIDMLVAWMQREGIAI